jgi:rhodanese-related sulfurtransferase
MSSAEQKRRAKDALYAEFARLGKAVASPRRLELLDLLTQGEKTVESLASQANLGLKNASAQLKVLRAARLIESRREGQRIFYRAASDDVGRFWLALRTLGEGTYAELHVLQSRHFADPDGVASIERTALLAGVKRGKLLLIDVRPRDEFAAGHIPGARSIPIDELDRSVSALPKDKPIVAYCRGRYCTYAIEAVRLLRRRGFSAVRFDDGVVEWREAGLGVEREPTTPAAKASRANNTRTTRTRGPAR